MLMMPSCIAPTPSYTKASPNLLYSPNQQNVCRSHLLIDSGLVSNPGRENWLYAHFLFWFWQPPRNILPSVLKKKDFPFPPLSLSVSLFLLYLIHYIGHDPDFHFHPIGRKEIPRIRAEWEKDIEEVKHHISSFASNQLNSNKFLEFMFKTTEIHLFWTKKDQGIIFKALCGAIKPWTTCIIKK